MTVRWAVVMHDSETDRYETKPRKISSYEAAQQEEADRLARSEPRRYVSASADGIAGIVAEHRSRYHTLLDLTASTELTDDDLRQLVLTVPLFAAVFGYGRRSQQLSDQPDREDAAHPVERFPHAQVGAAFDGSWDFTSNEGEACNQDNQGAATHPCTRHAGHEGQHVAQSATEIIAWAP